MTDVQKLTRNLVFALVLVLVSFVARYIILGGLYPKQFVDTPETAGFISIDIPINGKNISDYGSDFSITSEKFFDNKNWAVVSYKNNDGLVGTVIVKKVNGAYLVVAGPSTQFSNSLQVNLPSSVSDYLIEKGLING